MKYLNFLLQSLFKKIRSWYRSEDSYATADLEDVFSEAESPRIDPNRGTVFWTSENGEQLTTRIRWLAVVAFVVVLVFIGQLWRLQVQKGQAFAIEGQYNRLTQTPIFSQRGAIYGRQGTRLAWSNATSTKSYLTRSYATTTGLAHVLGFVQYPRRDDSGNFFRTETSGQSGVEKGLQDLLSGTNGTKIVEVNALGHTVSESVAAPPREGEDVELSIDAELQHELFSLVESTAEERGFSAGAGVIMDVHTGELLALVSFPEYSPNNILESSHAYLANLVANSNEPFLNRATAGQFTPGSSIKPFVAAAALEEGVVTPQTEIVSTGQLRIENPYQPGTYTIFQDWKAHGPVNLREAIAVSSNVYFYQVGGGYEDQPGLGITRLAEYARGFGFGRKTGIEGLSETNGIVPTPDWKEKNFSGEPWRLGDTYNTAIGQYGFQVTPLQITRAIASIANGGELPKPTLLNNPDPELTEVSKDIDPEVYQVIREGMRLAVSNSEGTASGLNMDSPRVAAKTGTAELGSGQETGVNSWVTGFFPYEAPHYAFSVVMADGPRSNVIGGVYVMRRLLEWMRINRPDYLETAL